MVEIKLGAAAKVVIALRDSNGAPVTGKTISDTTKITLLKGDATTETITSGGGATLTEVTTDAFSGLGVYVLGIPAGSVNVVKEMTIAVSGSAWVTRPFVVNVVAQLESDTYAIVLALKAALNPIVSSVNDASATTTGFVTALSSTVTDFYAGCLLVPTSGALVGLARHVSAYNGTTKAVTLLTALPAAPGNGDTFALVPLGRRLTDYLAAIGTDGRPRISADAHTAGATIAAVSGGVGGDVAGKVLGGGSGTISAVGVRAQDHAGADLATASAVAAIPTTPLLASSYTAPDNAGIASAAASASTAATQATAAASSAATAATQSTAAASSAAAVDARLPSPPASQSDVVSAAASIVLALPPAPDNSGIAAAAADAATAAAQATAAATDTAALRDDMRIVRQDWAKTDQLVFDAHGVLISGRLRLFGTKADYDAETNAIYEAAIAGAPGSDVRKQGSISQGKV